MRPGLYVGKLHGLARLMVGIAFAVALCGCGGGGGGGGSSVSNSPLVTTLTPSAIVNFLGIGACVAGSGVDYQVGVGKPYTALESVPWEHLQAGDTVRIFYSTTPYASKFMIMGQGTANAPIRICGVPGPAGERPIIDGTGAKSRSQLAPFISNDPYYLAVHESRSIVQIKNDTSLYYSFPQYIQIDGLNIRNAYPGSSYINTSGQQVRYGYAASDPLSAFTSCIWIDRGQNITIANNEISGCPMAIYTKSTDFGFGDTIHPSGFSITKNVRIAGNYMWGAGYPGDVHEHTTYTESQGIVIEYNHFGLLHLGAQGNSIKDRSIGTVVRYNLIEDGAHAFDLVEAEDFPLTATADPAYRNAFVYGNIVTKDGSTGSVTHYGGDHFGSAPGNTWGEPIFRQGTLYFFNNTVYTTGTVSWLFQIATTLEHVEAWNNIFTAATTNTQTYMRMPQYQMYPATGVWIPSGTINLGINYISTGWADTSTNINYPISGLMMGYSNMLIGNSIPIDTTTYIPLANSVVLDASMTGPQASTSYLVTNQISSTAAPSVRPRNGVGMDLGAVER